MKWKRKRIKKKKNYKNEKEQKKKKEKKKIKKKKKKKLERPNPDFRVLQSPSLFVCLSAQMVIPKSKHFDQAKIRND